MHTQKWISIHQFADNFNISTNNIYVQKSLGNISEDQFRRIGKELYIESNFFIRRKEFKRKIRNLNNEKYYRLIENKSPHQLAIEFAEHLGCRHETIYNWFRDMLFSIDNLSILACRITQRHWDFFKYKGIE